ncbi:restriction endonuclease subunit S [Vibrio cholerae]|uniref:restriction endonuclease subunit S n=1 Tax=Vibrio cholerae TaxID=666 RepID=UPI00028F0F8C|nr:restriction endonuclease subunit S [Vibrio cholerae]EKK99348.1 type I restriction modification DNA specificity domain protein [Vibrio cholerae CP1035(8)]NOF74298.1 restriction endonuclease subunit S [Vibrio cholerae]
MAVENLITEHIKIWTSAVKTKSTSGRGSSNKLELYGVKKLRELILELAVRGKLVPQDPNDEPASDLLVESLKEKDALIKKGIVKKSRSKKTIKEEHFYDYPASWVVSRLEDLINVVNGRAYKKAEMLSEGTPILRVGNLFTSNDWYYSDLKLEADKYIDNGDLIYAWSASFGPFIWDGGKVIYHYHIWKMDIFRETSLDKEFSKLFLQAISERIKASGNGIAMIHMTKERMEKVMHPLPPINEQKQIVNRVNKLMTLCDQLEQQTEASVEAHQVLVTTLLDTLTNSADADELMQNWARISEHFDTLFTTEESIDQLKQTILQLAVMGKLVPQDPNDEPAAELLKRIAEEKAQLVKDKKIKKQKALPPISEDEKPFELPNGWEWCRLGDLAEFQKGYAFKSKDYLSEGLMITKIQNLTENSIRNSVYISAENLDEYEQFILLKGDIVITTVGSWFSAPLSAVGRSFVINEVFDKSLLNQNAVRVRAWKELNSMFTYNCLNSKFFKDYLVNEAQGTANQASITQLSIKNFLMCIPPKNEQARITSKITELVATCNQLKACVKESQATQLQLTDAIVEQAV